METRDMDWTAANSFEERPGICLAQLSETQETYCFAATFCNLASEASIKSR
jgi:hypothetical protein